MFGPEWSEGCPSCSLLADTFDGVVTHLASRHITPAAVSHAPYSMIEPFQQRMGWRFHWFSSNGSDFNLDCHVSFTKDQVANKNRDYNYGQNAFPADEGPGVSLFYKEAHGDTFHTYSSFARGAEAVLGVYNFIDMTPQGRGEANLAFPMAWVRHHDRYDESYFQDAKPAPPAKRAGHSCCSPGQQA
ncbi:MAG TPA: DUF899 family protein [Candidatus Saccharimonadales bacterium]|nr:DUF899 family protein [Candidatus Saccharimonadales bacterium]